MKTEISYERDLQGAYMELPAAADGTQKYQRSMILENTIQGCLTLREQKGQDGTTYRYTISSLVSLPEYLDHDPLTEDLIKQLVFCLYQVIAELGEYLLQEEYLLLTPETIFLRSRGTEQKSWDVLFCLYPDGGQDWKKSLQDLLKYLMAHTDGTQERSGPLCYELYGLLQKDNFCLREWMDVLAHFAIPETPKEPEPKKGAKQLFASSRKGGIMKKIVR